MSDQTLDQRIQQLLLQRYPGAQMDALDGFLSKLFKKVKKVVKKVAPIALGAAGLYFGGKAIGGALTKKLGKGKRMKLPKGKRGRVARVPAAQVAASQRAASAAISAGTIPLQPGALRTTADLLSTAVQIAQPLLLNEGVAMNSPAAQAVVRQAVAEYATAVPRFDSSGALVGAAPGVAGFDWQKALPWVAGGGGLLLLAAMTMGARRPR